jgi:lycopene beta-cyclase
MESLPQSQIVYHDAEPRMRCEFDYVLVGGGLQNGLIALALLQRRPDLRLAVVEREGRLGGNHTWCFHAADVPPAAAPFVDPLVVRRWPGYEVIFPGRRRVLNQPYAAISSERFEAVLRRELEAAPGCTLFVDREAVVIAAHEVVLADGRTLTAATVIDARGPDPGARLRHAAFQKFVGLEVRLAGSVPPRLPIVMDARVSQERGFHFVYVLPFGGGRLLVEDTLFGDDPRLDRDAMREAARRYLDAHALTVGAVLREESGVLPMPWAEGAPTPRGGPLVAGVRGGWFHPGTGYSFPLALRLALLIADRAPAPPGEAVDELHRATRRQARFVHFLNRIAFRAIRPSDRWRLMERFYALPEDLITRYYSLDLGLTDRARILLAGRPFRELTWPRANAHGGGGGSGDHDPQE